LAAQNLQCLENYHSSLIDLPPSIDQIYATNDMISLGSRFNHLMPGMGNSSLQGKLPENHSLQRDQPNQDLPNVLG